MTTYFTSDTHFFHKNVIRHSNRPFANADEMNEEMVRRWNARVHRNDTVYHLGDVGFASPARLAPLLDRLNGTIHLNIGNHDSKAILKMDRWASVEHYREVSIEGTLCILSHYAHRSWNKSHYGSLMLFGHSHGNLSGTNQSLDVGVDCWDYQPITLREIKDRMANLPSFVAEDFRSNDERTAAPSAQE